jgi:hypothetical protein
VQQTLATQRILNIAFALPSLWHGGGGYDDNHTKRRCSVGEIHQTCSQAIRSEECELSAFEFRAAKL